MEIRLTHDGSRTLYSETSGQCYHSVFGAWSESTCVYLENSGVARRLREGLPTTVLEIGIGSGMNFLNTADLALVSQTPLNYFGIDTNYPSGNIIRELGMQIQLRNPALESEWVSLLEAPINFGEPHACHELVTLTPILGTAENWVTNPTEVPSSAADAIFLDAFSPEVSPELWTEEFFVHLFKLLKPAGTLTSYCVKSKIQKRLKAQGFEVFCCPGPEGGKREVLLAKKADTQNSVQ